MKWPKSDSNHLIVNANQMEYLEKEILSSGLPVEALMEKVVLSNCIYSKSKNVLCITRYGNVIGSRGSVIPLFVNQIKKNNPITITDPKMTRFLMSLDESVELVLTALSMGKQGDIFVQKSPSATIEQLCKAIIKIYKKKL